MAVLLAPNGKPSNLTPEQYLLVRTPAFKRWFGDWENDPENASKVVDKNGEPLVVYHTTDADFYVYNKKKSKDGFFFSANKQRLIAYNKTKILSVFLNIKNPSPNQFEVKGFDGIMDYGYNKNKDVEGLYEIIAFESNQIKLADGTNTTFDSDNPDIRFDNGGEVENLISNGVVELKMFDTKPEHAKEYGLDSINPLFVQRLCVTENARLKGIGNKVLKYIDAYAIANGHDVVFGHITQKANFTKDGRETNLCDIDLIKSLLRKNGYDTRESNNDFHKMIELDSDVRFDGGGRTVAQTPAPKSERIYGSSVNVAKSSKDITRAKTIKFDDKTLDSIKNKVKEHNTKNPDKKINLASAKAVVRRGMGAYSKSHRPTITGGKPNSRVAWGLARLNAFTYKIENGQSKSGKYSQDDDLIKELGFKVSKYESGGSVNSQVPNYLKMFLGQ